jgi:hypothetical protein
MKLALLLLAFLLVSCTTSQTAQVTGTACTADEDCELPMEYAVRSSCAFATACVQGSCAVVCYTAHQAPDVDYPVACSEDRECNCDAYAPADLIRCACISGKCAAVVNETVRG